MDVELLSKMIAELIVDHDRVGLPGVGTFFTELVPSAFSDRGYTINPPYRRLSFLPNAVENDLLVDFYAEVNGIPADVSREYLSQFLAELCEVLKERKTIILPGLGRLRATRENNFFFVPDGNLDIYPEAFGLAPVSLKNLPASDDDKVEIPFEFKVRRPDAAAISPAPADASAGAVTEPDPESPMTGGSPDADQERRPVSGRRVAEPGEPATSDPGPATAEPEPASGGRAIPVEESSPEPAVTDPGVPSGDATVSEPERSAPETGPSDDGSGPVADADTEAGGAESSVPGDLLSVTVGESASAVSEAAGESSPESGDAAAARKKFRWWIPLLAVIALAAVALAAFLILADVAPDFIDSILYTPDELRIINY